MSEVTTAVAEVVSPYAAELAKYQTVATDKALSDIAQNASKISIKGEQDKDGYTSAVSARVSIKKFVAAIEKKRKELKQSALDYGRAVDAEAQRLTLILEPELLRLTREIDDIDAIEERRKEAIRQEQERKAIERINDLAQYGYVMTSSDATVMSDEAFEIIKKSAIDAHVLRQEEERKKQEDQAAKDAELEQLRAKVAAMQAQQNPVQEEAKSEPAVELTEQDKEALMVHAHELKNFAARIRNAKYPTHDQFPGINDQVKTFISLLADRIDDIAFEMTAQ